MYLFKNSITNPDPDVQDKACYFADCFDFILTHMGKYDFPSMESHRSILDKIRFQLINYDPRHSGKYIHHHANHSFLDKKDEIMKSYYHSYRGLVNKLREGFYKDNAERQNILSEVESFILDLEESLMKNAMEEIQSVLHCVEPLSAHNHSQSLDYATGIIISEFRFTGFKVSDIDRLFENILSNDIKLIKGKPFVEFPLPAKLLEKQFAKSPQGQYQQALETFMENRTLREQFQGISNLYENTEAINKVLFRISNVHSKKAVRKTYGAVKLTTSARSYINSRSSERSKEMIKENGLYFEVTVHSTNINAGQLLAMDLIKKELPRFEIFFGTTIIVDFSMVLMKINGHTQMKQSLNAKWLPDINPVKNKLEKKLNRLISKASASFRQLEIIFAQAKTAQLPEQKLNYYWRYLEACRGKQGLDIEQLMQRVAEILANWELNGILFNYYQIASEVLWEHRECIERENIILDYREIMDFLDVNTIQSSWIIRADEILNHPFLKLRCRRMFKMKIKDVRSELMQYYSKLFFEAYEQRNFIQHAGVFHPMAIERILLNLPGMFETLRAALLSVILKGRYDDISQVLEHLVLPPVWMSKMIRNDQLMSDL